MPIRIYRIEYENLDLFGGLGRRLKGQDVFDEVGLSRKNCFIHLATGRCDLGLFGVHDYAALDRAVWAVLAYAGELVEDGLGAYELAKFGEVIELFEPSCFDVALDYGECFGVVLNPSIVREGASVGAEFFEVRGSFGISGLQYPVEFEILCDARGGSGPNPLRRMSRRVAGPSGP